MSSPANIKMIKSHLAEFCISPEESVREALAMIDRNCKGIALVLDSDGHLQDTITDGDIRRAILAGYRLDDHIHELLVHKASSAQSKPVTARVGTDDGELLRFMQEHGVRQLPLLDDRGHVAGLITLDELLPAQVLPMQAVIMVGGSGRRLRPFTEDLPKPMLDVGGKPLMQRVIEQLRQVGIRRVDLATHYKSEKIVEHFGDGSAFGVELNYVNEVHPLGTGGALGLMETPNQPLLVINGDILTQVNFRAMLQFHQEHEAHLTVAVRRYEMEVPYGVVECDAALVRRLREKPQIGFLVNAGIYLLEPSVFHFVPQNTSFNMPDLIQWLLDAQRTVVSFPIHEYWLDIGQHADYARAQGDIKNGEFGE